MESNLTIDDTLESQNNSFERNDNLNNDGDVSRKRSFQESVIFGLTEIAKNKEKYTDRTFKKKKITRPIPVYTEGSNPAQILNEIYPGLAFTYDVDTIIPSEMKFICQVEIKHEILTDDNQMQSDEVNFKISNFKGIGNSKKESKRNCCYLALSTIFADSYKLPESLILKTESSSTDKKIHELNKRINKVFNQQTLKMKTASQLLHELCSKISETAKCVSESGDSLDKKFAYQIENLDNESLVQLSTNPNENFVIGFGKFFKLLLINSSF